MSGSATVLAIDVGTSSVRACYFDRAGSPIGNCAQKSYQPDSGGDGKDTLAPASLLVDVCEVIDQAVAGAPPGSAVSGVGLSTFWHSFLGIDRDSRPTTPILTWADRRAAAHAASLRRSHVTDDLQQQSGCPLHSSFWPARLLWLQDTEPAVYAATRCWLSTADYLFLELFGVLSTSVSMASGTGLFDLNRLEWSDPALMVAKLDRNALPNLAEGPNCGLVRKYAHRWPQLADVPWYLAIGDGACSNVGTGCIDENALVLTLGTSGSMRIFWEAEHTTIPDPSLWCYRVDRRRFAGGMALSEGGASAAWVRQILALDQRRDLEAELSRMAPDAHGLTVIPYFLGARSPGWLEGRTAAISGLSAATTPLEIYRAVLESVGLRFALLKRRLDRAWPRPRRIVATGAALLRSPVWSQIVADCVGEKIAVSGIDEGSLRGAALLTLERLGEVRALSDFEYPIKAVVSPDPKAHAIYCAAMERQDTFDRLLLESCR
jgi:gluconokinase